MGGMESDKMKETFIKACYHISATSKKSSNCIQYSERVPDIDKANKIQIKVNKPMPGGHWVEEIQQKNEKEDD